MSYSADNIQSMVLPPRKTPANDTPLDLPPPFQAITDLVRLHAAARPTQTALIQGDRQVDWRQLDAMVDRVAASLQRDGVKPNQAIAICAANSLEYVAVFLGALRAGVAVAPLATQSLPTQLSTMAGDSGARHLFVDVGVPAFETQATRISMDGSGKPSLAGWLAASSQPESSAVRIAAQFRSAPRGRPRQDAVPPQHR